MNKTKIFAAVSSALFLANFMFPAALMGQTQQYGTQEITADGETITMTVPGNTALGTAEVSLTDAVNTVAPIFQPSDVSNSTRRLAVEDIRGGADDGDFSVDAVASIPFTDISDPTNDIPEAQWTIATTTYGSNGTIVVGGGGGSVIYEQQTTPATGATDVDADFDISANFDPSGSDAAEFAAPVGATAGTLDASRRLLDAAATGGRVQRVATGVVHTLEVPVGQAVGVYSGRVTYTLNQ